MEKNQLERLINAFEKIAKSIDTIANEGISVCLFNPGGTNCDKMSLDLASMKVNDGLESVAEALGSIADKLEA